MFRSFLAPIAIGMALVSPVRAADVAALLDAAIAGDHRPEANRARDQYRHPKETLLFFGLAPAMTVVEIWPGGGWYTDILAPVLRDEGRLYAAHFAVNYEQAPAYAKQSHRNFQTKLAERPDVFGKVGVKELLAPRFVDIAPAGSVDMVLTFRNVHNWAKAGNADAMFTTFHTLLKPGGTLGVEEHRAKPGTSFEDQVKSGYMTEQYVVEAAERAGFRLVDKSEINANPRDTKDYPDGVWTLPPTLRLGDKDRDRYLAIGESDRMTLKFVKP